MNDQELAVWYNDHVIYPDKARLNCYYYRHYSFIKDIQMIICTVLGKKMEYNGGSDIKTLRHCLMKDFSEVEDVI